MPTSKRWSRPFRSNTSAWKIEKKCLKRKGQSLFDPRNAMLRVHLMSVLLGLVSYTEHYGMLRNPTTPVRSRHSWSTNMRSSSYIMFNLPRHFHDHARAKCLIRISSRSRMRRRLSAAT